MTRSRDLATMAKGYNSSRSAAFGKANPSVVAWTKTGAFSVSTAMDLYVELGGVMAVIGSGTVVSMPTPVTGTDYAIWCSTTGALSATSNFTTPPSTGAKKLGGFHYAPGGNATGRTGGDTTPAINAYSFWDLNFKPECPDARGMTLVANSFWADIYLLGVDHITNGTSKYNVTIADGASPPKVPVAFGGDGTTTYTSLNWWESAEVMRSYGKRMPTYSEFAALAFGTTEAASFGTDPVNTILREAYTSKWGVMLSSGNMWIWGDEFGGGAAAAGWIANTVGRGSTYQMENAALFGASWDLGSFSGSRASAWDFSATFSLNSIGARGACDHLILG